MTSSNFLLFSCLITFFAWVRQQQICSYTGSFMSTHNPLLKKPSWPHSLISRAPEIHYPTRQTIKHPEKLIRPREGLINMKRVLILGSSGSGKSTLARQLGARLELPVIHLDRHYWHPGWVGTPNPEWQNTIARLIQRDAWIMDGNYRNTLEMRLEVADSVVFLDLPPWICAFRALKRRIQYRNRPRPDIADGCKEALFDPKLIQFIHHVLSYPDRAKPYVMNQLSEISNEKHVVLLQSTTDVNNFLRTPLDFPSLSLIHNSHLPKMPQIAQMPMD
jgi:adenylate kinase family enzyme